MDTVVARPEELQVKVPLPKTKGPQSLTPDTPKEMPLEIYEQETRSKYINKVMETEGLLPDIVRETLDGIDDYMYQLIREKGYNPTTEAYKAVFEGLKKDLGIDDYTSFDETVERITKYIDSERIVKALKDVDEEKILRQLRKTPSKDLMTLVMRQVEKRSF